MRPLVLNLPCVGKKHHPERDIAARAAKATRVHHGGRYEAAACVCGKGGYVVMPVAKDIAHRRAEAHKQRTLATV